MTQPTDVIVLTRETGEKRSLSLAGVPRVGEHIRAAGDTTSYVVEHVLWLERIAGNGSAVMLVVSRYPPSVGEFAAQDAAWERH